jgi:hypothetical protein
LKINDVCSIYYQYNCKKEILHFNGARTNKELGKMTFEGVSFLSKLGTALFFSKEKVAENR